MSASYLKTNEAQTKKEILRQMKKTTVGVGLTACTLVIAGTTGIIASAQQLLEPIVLQQETSTNETQQQQTATYSPKMAEVRPFMHFADVAYSEAFKMPQTNIATISNNAGHYSNRVITDAIDNDPTTYWETNKANATAPVWNNEVEVTLHEEVTLDRIVFGARPDRKGFATQFEIYASTTDEGDDYQLVATGGHDAVTGFVEAKFAPTAMKRVKFKFVESTQNWATLSELGFYYEDQVANAMEQLFTDSSKSQLSPEYANTAALTQLEAAVGQHPLASTYAPTLEDAWILLNHEPLEATEAKTQVFAHYANQAYTDAFQLPATNIAGISNNAGHYSNRVITDAIDGDLTTYWETNKANTATWNNEVEVAFTEHVTLNRIVLGARPDTKGFVTKFEVYASMTTAGDTYELIATGGHQSTNALIEATFVPTKMKRVKIKFVESNQNWATINELAFYREDQVANAMEQLFTDSSHSQLNPAYATEAALTQLEAAVAQHPLASSYATTLEDAWILLNHQPLEATVATTQLFTQFANEAYSEAFKMPNTNIATITNNAGHYSNRVITNAIDGDLATYWETNKANTTTWNNELEVTFTERVTLDRIVLGSRPDTKGFATKFEVYASKTTSGETYELIATGGHQRTAELIEAKFVPTEMKRVKIKFVESNQDWATVNELAFYHEDVVTNTVQDLFVDQTYLALKPEYHNREVLEQLQLAVEQHPAQAALQELMTMAFQVLDGTIAEHVLVTANQDGDMNAHAKNTLSMSSAGQNLQATGVYGLPGEKVIIYLDVEPGTQQLPKISFSQNQGSWRGYVKTVDLKPGRNEIIVPEFDLSSDIYAYKPSPGGAAYIVNPYTAEQQGQAPKLRIEGAHEFPFYREGDDEAAFLAEVAAYQAKLTAAQAVGDERVLDLLEVESERVLISTLASAGYQVFINEGQQPSDLVTNWNDTFNALLDFQGLDGSSEVNDRKALKEHVRVMQPYGFLYAYTTHVGIQTGHASAVLREGFLNSWGMAHETGHRFDNKYRTWGEITNNMESTYASILGGNMRDRVKYEEVFEKTAKIEPETTVWDGGYFVGLGAFWQLQIADENYWPQLNRLYRERKPAIPTEQEKNNYLVKYSSEVLGVNVSEHFARHGILVSDAVAAELAATYPETGGKYWYLHTKAYDYQGPGLAATDTATITALKTDGTLQLQTTAQTADFLGYEVLRDGEVIGFTDTETFVDADYQSDTNVTYTVIPYGSDLVAGKESAGYASFTPKLAVQQADIYLPLYAEFDPLAYVVATNYQGETLTDAVDVTTNVKMAEKGSYHVEYALTDQGITTTATLNVHVLAQATPLSDLTWESATQSYKSVKKDGNLNGGSLGLLDAKGEIVTYEKGLGTHANAEITYDLSQGNYVHFTSDIGIDHSMLDRPGSVVFAVYLDGEKHYESGKMTATTPMKHLSVPLAGVQELKLVVTDAGDGNGADHATWGNPTLLTASEMPTLSGIEAETLVPFRSDFDLLAGITAHDVEDGDLTSQITVESNQFDINVPGVYPVTYSITDRDGQVVTQTRIVTVYSAQTFASDLTWKSATSGWKNVNKDSAVNTTAPIKLNIAGTQQTFAKGLGAAATAEIVYDLGAHDYEYFSAYVGTDKNWTDSRTSIQFIAYADGVEVYRSSEMGEHSPAEWLKIPVTGVKELRLVADNVDGSGLGDYASWGDAQFITTNSRPTLNVEADAVYEVGTQLDEATIIGTITAHDIEDGDLTPTVQVSGVQAVTTTKPGNYPVTYQVSDSQGNVITQERTIAIVDLADYDYLTDFDWTKATQSYSTTHKDQHYSGTPLRLSDETGASVTYERGLGTHANAEIIYDLTQTDAVVFSTYVGIDRTMYNSTAASVIFEVYVDGEKVAATDVMYAKDPQQYIQVPIVGAKELKLIVNNAGNGNGSDHGTFGDSKLHYVNADRADLRALQALVTELEAYDLSGYTSESVQEFQTQLAAAQALLVRGDVLQAEADAMYQALQAARDQLVTTNREIEIPDTALKQAIIQTLGLPSDVVSLHDLERLTTLNLEFDYVQNLAGLQFAKNLTSLNLNYNETMDLRPLQNLAKLTDFHAQENFRDLGQATFNGQEFIIQPEAVYDIDGTRLEPEEIVLSARQEMIVLPKEQVYRDGEIRIDAKLLAGKAIETVEIMYASPTNDFSFYTFHWLQLPAQVEANPIVAIPDAQLQAAIRHALAIDEAPLRASDLAQLTTLDLEGQAITSLTGLEYAVKLTDLNLNYNEVHDLRPLALLPQLTKFQGQENFTDLGQTLAKDGKFTIEPLAVYDRDGSQLEPQEIVLSARQELIQLPVADVYQNGIITIDASLLGDKALETVEIKYASPTNDYSMYTFHWLKK